MTIDEILNSELLNSIIEQDDKDLSDAGWTIDDARNFAKFLIKNK